MRRIVIAGLLWLLGAAAARADNPVNPVTVGQVAVQVLAALTTTSRRLVAITNQGTDKIACAVGNAAPAVGAAGSYDIWPGKTRRWSAANVTWNDAFYCVSLGAATPVSVEAK